MTFTRALHPLKDGRLLAEAVLDSPATLNALTQEMVNEMSAALDDWRADERVVAVFVRGGGDKHFCAGGNVLDQVDRIKRRDWAAVGGFFQSEYRLDLALHQFPKPVIGWATGVVMGGGMGVFQGCDVRLASAKIKMAMPEVSIGLFPDVGANWFLRECQPCVHLFLGLTGTTLNTNDALLARLVDYALPDCPPDEIIRRLCAADWGDTKDDNLAVVCAVAASLHRGDPDNSALYDAMMEIDICCAGSSVAEIADDMQASPHPYLQDAAARLAAASPAAAVFWHRYWKESTATTLEEVFATDYAAVMAFCRDPNSDFVEGVRALLVDKDKNPRWQFSRYDEVPENWPPIHPDDAAAVL